MTEEKKQLDRDEIIEKLCTPHDVTVYYTSGYEAVYRVSQYALRNFMVAIASGDDRHSLPCAEKTYIKDRHTVEWVDKFVTINFAQVTAIYWPEEAAKQMHENMGNEIDELADEAVSEVVEADEADEEEAE